MRFSDSYLGKLRKIVGKRLILIPGARIVVHDRSERVLLELRSDFRRWGLPGGHQEIGDSSAETAIREVFEETGLKIARPKVFGIASDPRHETIRFPNGDRTQTVSVMFHASKPRGTPKFDPRETLELGWFALDGLPANLMPNSGRTLKAFQRYRKTGKFQMI
ncbi:MAG TPA: NUDIX domain-containing protein [Dongiaceae bacterium]|jgi:8-oxo-dGTP pyrophosphatase MutT (NUDIX family)|nr:NUDIX domain-containing protein [Dongiaceae bacterium]